MSKQLKPILSCRCSSISRKKGLIVLLLCVSLLWNEVSALTEHTAYVESENDLLVYAMNMSCKYILTKWWYEEKDDAYSNSYLPNKEPLSERQRETVDSSLISFSNWRNEDYLLIPNWEKNDHSENAILPSCYACRIVSTALHYHVYDSKIVGVSEEDARKMIRKLIISLAKYHLSNSEEGWGNCWQGALWAEMLGMSGYLMKDYLSDPEWNLLCNVVLSEANYVANEVGVKVYKDRVGRVREGREGDSQSDNDSWNATILALAFLYFPDHEQKTAWREKLIELCVETMTRPSDVYSYQIIDGYDFINSYGSNINEDGTVTNHGKIHIDYMVCPIEEFAECFNCLQMADYPMLECLTFNVDIVYDALVNQDLGVFELSKAGHHFYERDDQGNPTYVTNMPQENEWGSFRQANYYLADTYVDIIGADSGLPVELKANRWAEKRMKEIIRMMSRNTDGSIYVDGEEQFASGQVYAMACLAQAYMLRNGEKSYKYYIDKATSKIRYYLPVITTKFPNISENGTDYTLHENKTWTSSFYIGERYLAYEVTHDPEFLDNADDYLNSFERRLTNRVNLDHDVGFLYAISCVHLYNMTGNERARELAIAAADVLYSRFITKGGYIQAWDPVNDGRRYRYLIIDTMMNIPLLYWASEITGDTKYENAATAHAEYTAKCLIRDDYSIVHRCQIDSETGTVHVLEKGAGYSDKSAWARGQAWAVYGYAIAYRWTGNERFLEIAIRLADYYIDHLPSEHIPYWDLVFSDDNSDIKDTSAGAILACGLIELSGCNGDTQYQQIASKIVNSLSQKHFIDDEFILWLLNDATYVREQGNVSTVWGDYFYLEALLKLARYEIHSII